APRLEVPRGLAPLTKTARAPPPTTPPTPRGVRGGPTPRRAPPGRPYPSPRPGGRLATSARISLVLAPAGGRVAPPPGRPPPPRQTMSSPVTPGTASSASARRTSRG